MYYSEYLAFHNQLREREMFGNRSNVIFQTEMQMQFPSCSQPVLRLMISVQSVSPDKSLRIKVRAMLRREERRKRELIAGSIMTFPIALTCCTDSGPGTETYWRLQETRKIKIGILRPSGVLETSYKLRTKCYCH